MAPRYILATLAGLALARPALAADEAPGQVMPGPFDGLARNFVNSFAGLNFGFHMAAVAATATMTTQDVDLRVHTNSTSTHAGDARPIRRPSWASPDPWRCSAGCASWGA